MLNGEGGLIYIWLFHLAEAGGGLSPCCLGERRPSGEPILMIWSMTITIMTL